MRVEVSSRDDNPGLDAELWRRWTGKVLRGRALMLRKAKVSEPSERTDRPLFAGGFTNNTETSERKDAG